MRRLSLCLLGTRTVLDADIGRRNLLIPRTAYCRTNQKRNTADHDRRRNDLLNQRDGNLGGDRGGGLTVRLPVGRELRGTAARSKVLTESDGPREVCERLEVQVGEQVAIARAHKASIISLTTLCFICDVTHLQTTDRLPELNLS